MSTIKYSIEPENKESFTEKNDQFYTYLAHVYDFIVKLIPAWKKWLVNAIPHIRGPRVLEVSFGTGYLLMQYANDYSTFGIDYNRKLTAIAKKNLEKIGTRADLQVGNVEALPYDDETFDSIVNTMAMTGYPDGNRALSEIHRVLKKGGQFVCIDINYPKNRNWVGMIATRLWGGFGDIIRDMDVLLGRFGFEHTEEEIGGFGSVHLYVAQKY